MTQKKNRPLWLNICLVLLGCGLASGGLGLGLSVVINYSLAQAGSTGLDVLFQGSDDPAAPGGNLGSPSP